jgi:tellurite resistance protein TerC
MDWSIIVIILQLIFLEGILSIDNAAVLGAMVVPLPKDKPIEWPALLQKAGHLLDPILGAQRTAALRVGLLGAYLGRGIMLLLASYIINNPWLRLVGAAYLVHLAFDNLSNQEDENEGGDEDSRPMKKTASFWAIVLTVELMDLAFSVDNVVAAVALSNKLPIVLLGVALGILAMRFAAGWFSILVEKEPILETAAYILILAIGIELILADLAKINISDLLRFVISISIIGLTLAYQHFKFLRFLRPVLVWLGSGFGHINDLINWILVPFLELIKLIWRIVSYPFVLARKAGGK